VTSHLPAFEAKPHPPRNRVDRGLEASFNPCFQKLVTALKFADTSTARPLGQREFWAASRA